jgi:alpha-ketoglutarate-dependent taurine dioxygenase
METKEENPDLKRFKRKLINARNDGLVRAECLCPPGLLPLAVSPAQVKVSLTSWAENNRDFIESNLLKHGAILFRGFDVRSAADFESFVCALCGEPMHYRERSSPRSQVQGNIYTSTDYPQNQRIFPHNEHSYSHTWPMKLFFYCEVAPRVGGQTPLADTRKVLDRIGPEIVERFIKKRYTYVRNFGEGIGLPWQTVFQTADKSAVEQYCRSNDIEFEWKEGDRLRTRQVREAVRRHPRTGELTWFNHATFFNNTTLEPEIGKALREQFDEDDLPNNTLYGDGSPIEDRVLEHLRQAYLEERVIFDWREGDVILLDNMLTSHARESFDGPRRILFAMAEPYSYRTL